MLLLQNLPTYSAPEMSLVVGNSCLMRSWYAASIADFLLTDSNTILGSLASNCDTELLTTQRDAWLVQIDILRTRLKSLEGWIFFEFNIPRMGRRVDVILVLGAMIFPLEFKVGEKAYDRAAIDQVWDYALDLKNFHEASHNAAVAPILIATEAEPVAVKFEADADNVYRPVLTNPDSLRQTLELGLSTAKGSALDAQAWARASYKPTPTIIEAARALYAQHSVEAIARFDAGAQNLHITSKRIEDLVDEARRTGQKFVCFVTGVPGAGKTLVGLNIATQRRDENAATRRRVARGANSG